MEKPVKLVIVAFFLLGFLAGQAFYIYLFSQTIKQVQAPSVQTIESPKSLENSATIFLPAIDSEGEGVILPFTVQKRQGYGETLIGIKNLLFWFDTQRSIQTAKDVAQRFSRVDTSELDLVYLINTHAPSRVIEGPSAGAALTIATIAALKDLDLNESVAITGTINPDGTIGRVGGLLEKAMAARSYGVMLFLVPNGESSVVAEVPEERCNRRGGIIYCETIFTNKTIIISEKANLSVKEVSNIAEAAEYFFHFE